MGHKNYSKFSQHIKKKEQNNDTSEVTEVVNEKTIEVENAATPEITTGVVTGCAKLYVRALPKKESEHLCIIEETTEVKVNITESTMYFYKVKTSSGIEGYCMKEFISVR